jgi:hypothetical protein
MAAQAVRDWQQMASYIDGLADISGSSLWERMPQLNGTQLAAYDHLVATNKSGAPRAVWKKLLQQQVCGWI